MPTTGEILRTLRQLKENKPQKDIAEKLGISQSSYYKWEKARSVTDAKLERFLKAINCPKEEFERIKKNLLSPPEKPE